MTKESAKMTALATRTRKPPDQDTNEPCKAKFEAVQGKIRKPGTECLYQVSKNLWEGSYFPRLADGKRKKFNVYAKTREECEILLAEMIPKVKAEIAEAKAKLKSITVGINKHTATEQSVAVMILVV